MESGSCNNDGVFARGSGHGDHNWWFFKTFAKEDLQGAIVGAASGVIAGPGGVAGGAFIGGTASSWGWAIGHWIFD